MGVFMGAHSHIVDDCGRLRACSQVIVTPEVPETVIRMLRKAGARSSSQGAEETVGMHIIIPEQPFGQYAQVSHQQESLQTTLLSKHLWQKIVVLSLSYVHRFSDGMRTRCTLTDADAGAHPLSLQRPATWLRKGSWALVRHCTRRQDM